MEPHFYNKLRLGILGGGQLGRMLLQKAIDYNITTSVLDPDPDAPCKNICDNFVEGSFTDYETVYQFGKSVNLLTIEIEHVNVDALAQLEKEGISVFPQSRIISMVQDKGAQKIFFRTHGIPTAEFHIIDSMEHLGRYASMYPCMQKLRRGGYDGKGVQKLNTIEDIPTALIGPSIIEKLIDFEREISVIVARNQRGEVAAYPAVDMDFNPEANLVEYLYSPSSIDEVRQNEALELAIRVANSLQIVGVLAVEMFLTKDGDLLVNEIAPRPHNSGHQTIEGNITSQYDQHLRAIFNLPLGSTKISQPSVMVNLLGDSNHQGEAVYKGLEKVLAMEGVHVHLYGKRLTKPFRKMGHITILADSLQEAKQTAVTVKKTIQVVAAPEH
ncbi:MAG TPA: 5-(carboxyamino)imidazole ribonucleotide synthase [Bacteroidia bacterium]|nr:5-(carboxyamino)imidazole ribonucleotide synthase [Bacteroidia bacterium]HNS12324.1 5-(carboxyamino)imidazole ribonucleotide synthase [Bacteroidia bacterium]